MDRHFVLQFRRILWFGPRRSHSSVPARTMVRRSRAAAVKDGPVLGPPEGLVLDGRERGGRLVWVGGDTRQSAHGGDRITCLVIAHEPEPFGGDRVRLPSEPAGTNQLQGIIREH